MPVKHASDEECEIRRLKRAETVFLVLFGALILAAENYLRDVDLGEQRFGVLVIGGCRGVAVAVSIRFIVHCHVAGLICFENG